MGKVLLAVPHFGSVVGSASGSLPQVLMMQTANQRYLDHLPSVGQLHRSLDRTVIDAGGLRGNKPGTASASGVAVVRATQSRDPDIPGGSIRLVVRRKDFAKTIWGRSVSAGCPLTDHIRRMS